MEYSDDMSGESVREFRKENKWYDSEGWKIIENFIYNQLVPLVSDKKVWCYDNNVYIYIYIYYTTLETIYDLYLFYIQNINNILGT